MVDFIERPLVVMRPLGAWLATRFLCLCRQLLAIGVEARDFCPGAASSVFDGVMLVT